MNRDQLIAIYEDTKNKCTRGKFKKLTVCESILYRYDKDPSQPNGEFESTEIEIINGDTLVVAEQYAKEENNLLILNMASATYPGGGVEIGSMAQEEELFRRTNYFKTLIKNDFYPIKRPDVILSPQIWIVKDENYNDLEEPWSASFITASMPKRPNLSEDGKYLKKDYMIAKRTIEHVFKIAFEHDYEVLILGAIGCGAYKNPQEQVIEIFNEMLEKYDGCFKKIIFAIYSKNDDNYDMFNEHINK